MAKTSETERPPGKRKTRLVKPHKTGILVPPWWRTHRALGVLGLSVGSVIAALIVIGSASDRVGHAPPQEQPRIRDVDSIASAEPAVQPAADHYHDEEPLPQDVYEHAPVTLPDPADGVPMAIEDPGAYYEAVPLADSLLGKEEVPPTDAGTAAVPTETAAEAAPRAAAPQPDVPETTEPDPDTEVAALPPAEQPVAEPVPTTPEAAAPIMVTPPWRQFAVPFQSIENRAMVAIVIDDMGVSRHHSEEAVDLPGPLTMSYLTYARDINEQADEARRHGHEIMLHVPMEPGSPTVDPGPNVLKTDMTKPEIVANLIWGMKRLKGFVGINNHMGSKFTQDRDGMRAVLETVAQTGHLFLDSRTSGKSVASDLAHEIGLPFVSRNVFIDHEDDRETIRAQLQQVERLAARNGAVIAIGHPRPNTIAVLKEWLPTLSAKGLQLAPLTAVVLRTLEESGTELSSR